MNKIFVLGDGNRIRVRIESHLFKHEFQKVKLVSQSITSAIGVLREIAITELNADIIMAGGDDMFFTLSDSDYKESTLIKMADTFLEMTACSFSFGVGNSIEVAHSNLNKAKVYKKTIVRSK